MHLVRQNYRPFLPLRPKTVRHARQFRTTLAPLFPGYLFMRLDLARDRWRSVNGTHGVVSLVMAGLEPLPVPPGIVETLIEISSEQGIVRLDQDLQPGQRVKILAGPFAEQLGTLERLGNRGRVEVLLQMMGAHARIAVAAGQIAPA